VNRKAKSSRISTMSESAAPIMRFLSDSAYAHRDESREICDSAFGNPHEMPLAGFVQALQKAIVPQNKDWFAYKLSEAEAHNVISATLSERLGHEFESVVTRDCECFVLRYRAEECKVTAVIEKLGLNTKGNYMVKNLGK
jgi:hypothetical protein